MIDKLPFDCQVQILKYLLQEDTIALWLATENRSQRLNDTIVWFWGHQRRHDVCEIIFDSFECYPHLLDVYLGSICQTVEKMKLVCTDIEFLRVFKSYSFPRMRQLTYTVEEEETEKVNLIAELFPGLVSVTPEFYFSFQHVGNLTQLRILELYGCMLTEYPDSDDEIESLEKCQMLEELKISMYYLDVIPIDTLLSLPKFQRLYVIDADLKKNRSLINDIKYMRGEDLHEIAYKGDIVNFLETEKLRRLDYLRKLTLHENNLYNDEYFDAQKQSLLFDLPKLEHLNLVNFRFWRSEIELWRTIKGCRSLKILNISGKQLEIGFFHYTRTAMKFVMDNRDEKLILNCHDEGINKNLIRQQFKHPYIKVSFDPLPKMYPIINYRDNVKILQINFATRDP